MADQFVGEVRLVGFNFAPVGWATAAGQLLPISQNTALFSLLGIFYGGDGRSNFALPNLQGNVPIAQGQGPGLSPRDIGETGGEQSVTLLVSEVPQHTHTVQSAGGRTDQASPIGNAIGDPKQAGTYYASGAPDSPMSPAAISNFGSNQPHNNMMPYLVLNWVIALQGIFPARS